jgi:hypothetical protein
MYAYYTPYKPVNFGKIVFEGEVTTNCKDDEPTEIKISLTKYLNNNLGHLYVFAEPVDWNNPYNSTKPNCDHWVLNFFIKFIFLFFINF